MAKYLIVTGQGIGVKKTFNISFGKKLSVYPEDTLEGLLSDTFPGVVVKKNGVGFVLRRGTYASLVWIAATPPVIENQIVKSARENELILALGHGPCEPTRPILILELR